MSSNDFRRTVGEWLEQPYEWRIPVYQRHYAWKPDEEFGPTQLFWEIVEEQAKERLAGNQIDPHYFGVILVEKKTNDQEGLQTGLQKYDVVDGQQRLTTINVAMFAIIGVAGKFGYKQEIQNELAKYIFNHSESENRSAKVFPTNFDRTQFGNLLAFAFDSSQPKYQSDDEQARKSRIVQACEFFSKEFEKFIKENRADDPIEAINALIATITNGFELILIALKDTDESQKVFESLNNTARPLTTFDLIRNNIFYRADNKDPGSDVKLFNSEPWKQFENPFWEEHPGRSNKNTHIEAYIARMLMAKNKEYLLMDRNSIFKQYKVFAENLENNGVSAPHEVEIISEYVDVYKYLVGETKKNPLGDDFSFGYFLYKICKSMDFYPALFTIAHGEGDASIEERQRMVYLLESYVIRRSICKLTSGNYNIFAPSLFQSSGGKPNYRTLCESLTSSGEKETRMFPDDKRVEAACLNRNFYNQKDLMKYVFDRIVVNETSDFDEKRDIKGLTIDHIMPKAWRDKEGWKQSLDNSEEGDVDIKINTIGNLTPMSGRSNSAKSNNDWKGEGGARDWLAKCDLKFTRKLAEKETWGISDIDARSRELAGIICKIWPEDIPPKGQ